METVVREPRKVDRLGLIFGLLATVAMLLAFLGPEFASIGVALNALACLFLQRSKKEAPWTLGSLILTIIGAVITVVTSSISPVRWNFAPLFLFSFMSASNFVIYFSYLGVTRSQVKSTQHSEGSVTLLLGRIRKLHRNWWAFGSLLTGSAINVLSIIYRLPVDCILLSVPFYLLGFGIIGYGVILGVWQEFFERRGPSTESYENELPSI